MFRSKYQKISIFLPIWLSPVINQIVNKVKNALKQPHLMNPIFYIWRKSVTFKPRQDKTRHDKAWQGKARRGQTRQDEAAPRQKGVPWFWKILYRMSIASFTVTAPFRLQEWKHVCCEFVTSLTLYYLFVLYQNCSLYDKVKAPQNTTCRIDVYSLSILASLPSESIMQWQHLNHRTKWAYESL